MTKKSSFSEVRLDVNPGAVERAEYMAPAMEPDAPFRILLVGDFSGRPSAGSKPIEIDRDNFDEVLARLKPEVGGMCFRELDDFHPDQIYGQPVFRELRERQRKASIAAPTHPVPAVPPARPPLTPGISLLDSIVEAEEPEETKSPKVSRPERRGLDAVVDSLVAQYRVPAEDPGVARERAAADAEVGEVMRAILHAPAFQALEAVWRAVFRLVRNIETGTQLKLYLWDISKAELAADLSSSDDPMRSRLGRVLGSGQPWSVVAGNYAFAQTEADTEILRRIGQAMSVAGTPFLGEADPAGGGSEAELSVDAWDRLRQSAAAQWIGLAMPRVLLRLPYGKGTSPVESFEFEEMPGVPSHTDYLWGNPAFACVELLAEAFASEGEEMRPDAHTRIEGLPLHVYEEDGESQAKPCAEVLFTEHDLDWVMDQGYMALASVRDQDEVRLVRFQSIAKPTGRLAGRWE